jgi:2-amino-4-hydroxy-6-hydroxymethyldihydropteridine diphosphokinase
MPVGAPPNEIPPSVRAYVAIGANLGDAEAAVRQAMHALDQLPRSGVFRRSSLYHTAPITGHPAGAGGGPDYITAVVALDTRLSPVELLDQLQALEQAAGRERPYPDAPRTLDLDLLLYGDEHIDSPRLTVPHPRMRHRAFVLVPLAEITPQRVTEAELRAVADQAITRLDTAGP